MNANSSIFTPAFCYGAAIFAAFVTALSQIILKKQANILHEVLKYLYQLNEFYLEYSTKNLHNLCIYHNPTQLNN